MRLFSIFTFLFFYFSFNAKAQIDAGEDIIKCDTSSVTLNVEFPNDLLIGVDYSVESVPILMDDLSSSTSLLGLSDDLFSGIIDIGFDFTFYCNTYNQLIISTNNYICFDLEEANMYSPWNTYAIPNSTGASFWTITNSILGPWADLNPNNGGSIKYDIFGQAPNRRFVVSFEEFGYFSSLCSGLKFNGQIKLYETTNVIEVHIQDQPLCESWNDGESVLGIINEDESQYLIYPGWNNTQMTGNNEAFRFTPAEDINAQNVFAEWTNNSDSIIGTGASISVNPLETTNYTVTISDCENEYKDSVKVFVSSPININAVVDDNICPDEIFGSIEITTTGGTQPLSYNWSSSSNSFTSNSKNISTINSGTYQLIITDSLGCQTSSEHYVISPTPSPFNIDETITDVSCFGFSDGMISLNVSGGTPNYNFNWYGENPFNGNGTTTISALKKGNYGVIITDNNGCKDTSSFTVNENSPVNLDINTSNFNGFNLSCFGDENGWISVTPSGGELPYESTLKYLGSSEIVSNQLSTYNLKAGEYEVTVIDKQDCPNIQYIELTEPEKINIDIVNSEDESCTYNNDGVIEIEVTGGPDFPVSSQNYLPFEYQWTKHNQFYSTQKNIYGLESGTYTLSVTDKNGCTSIKSKEINQPPYVIADYRVLDDTVTIQYPIINIFDNSEGNIIKWYWELSNGFTSTNQNIYNLDLSTELDSSGVKYYDLKLVVIDENLCTDSIYGTLAFKDVHSLFVPNGFTPDGDGINDVFKIFHHGIKNETFSISIYDRYGSVIFKSNSPDFEWDGTNMFTNNKLISGAYTYVLKYQDFEYKIYDNANCKNCYGTISLIR